MYLRHTTIRKNGKVHEYWRLVRSVRVGRRVRQETVAFLGELDKREQRAASALARHFLGKRVDEPDLFEEPERVEMLRVNGAAVRVERSRVYRRTALEDWIGIPSHDVYHTRLYWALDKLLPHKKALDAHLKQRLGSQFELEYDLLLYDVTSTYFEGEATRNPLAQRGYSRDRRGDCKQVCIGLVVTREGFPLGYEGFAGNTTDVTTVEDVVVEMERRHGKASRVWVMDRGMVSEENLEWLRQGGREYLVGTPRSELKKWYPKLVDSDGWERVREDLEVKLCEGPDGTELLSSVGPRRGSRKRRRSTIASRSGSRLHSQVSRAGSSTPRSR